MHELKFIALVIMAIEALVILFQLRCLIDRTIGLNSCPPWLAGIVGIITGFVIGLMPFRLRSILGGAPWPVHVLAVGFIVAIPPLVLLVLYYATALHAISEAAGVLEIIFWSLAAALLMDIKCLGYLFIGLLLIQALCSWLPQTRQISMLCAYITAPVTVPVQRVIKPIGVIDISLMVILLGIFLLNMLIYRILPGDSIIRVLWYIL